MTTTRSEVEVAAKKSAKKPMKKKSDPKWMEKAAADMKAKGTKGTFKKAAAKAGKSVKEEAAAVTKPGSKASPKLKAKANFAKIAMKVGKKKKAKKK
jgi:type IV secretory pathway TrbL component